MKLPPSKAAQSPRRPRLTPAEALATLESTDPDIAASARSQMPNPPAEEAAPASASAAENEADPTPPSTPAAPAPVSKRKLAVEKPTATAPARRGRPPVHTAEGETERVAVYIGASLNLEVAEHLVTLRRQGEKKSHRSFTEEALRFYIKHLRKQGILPAAE